jgi:hypothetical protein
MERLRFRSTSAIDLMAELHQADLLAEASRIDVERGASRRRRSVPLAIRLFLRRRS